jgi:Flp pilus assembly protein TadB
MTLAFSTALLSLLLIIGSQVQRRTDRFNAWLPAVLRLLSVFVVILVATYFYFRFFA